MFVPNPLDKPEEDYLASTPRRRTRQHQLMAGALLLLVTALGLLLYNDRDFWFPNTLEADDDFPSTAMAGSLPPISTEVTSDAPQPTKKHHGAKPQAVAQAPAPEVQDPPPVTTVRTVLPPLQVEVIAGNVHHTLRPATNSLRVDTQPDASEQRLVDAPVTAERSETAAGVTSNAAENVQMMRVPTQIVSHSVNPDYPLLARQMKVQGAVVLQALINRDGGIEDLRIVSGPSILAGAAREAVRQWRFKPHYVGTEAVETQARITVNFTISTN
jgi:TonB family protein